MAYNTGTNDKTTQGKILEAQKETNKLLKNHLEAIREQNRKLDKITTILETQAQAKTGTDIRPLIELQKENNKLMKKLVDTTKIETGRSYTKPPEKPLNEFF
jgi:hypothetical protein